jgi:methylmalonyl-CoA carboxyltransferase large subunit
MSEPSIGDLLETVRTLTARVAALEEELADVRADIPPREVPPEVVVAISAAVAAFLGHRARLKQVHYRTGAAWTQQGRAAVQRRHVTHGVR